MFITREIFQFYYTLEKESALILYKSKIYRLCTGKGTQGIIIFIIFNVDIISSFRVVEMLVGTSEPERFGLARQR